MSWTAEKASAARASLRIENVEDEPLSVFAAVEIVAGDAQGSLSDTALALGPGEVGFIEVDLGSANTIGAPGRGLITARAASFSESGEPKDLSISSPLVVGPAPNGAFQIITATEHSSMLAQLAAQDQQAGEAGLLLGAIDEGQGLSPEAVALAERDDPGSDAEIAQ